MTVSRGIFLVVSILCLSTVSLGEEMMARLSDKDVIALTKTLGQQEKKFNRALDSKFKRSILRGSGKEIDVQTYLADLAEAIQLHGKRFTGNYAASTEATEVLRRADFMNSYIHKNPSMKGANEWDVFGSGLQQLAAAYSTSFPLPEDAVIRRIGDGELGDAATAINKFSKSMGKSIGGQTRKNKALAEPVKSIKADLKTMTDISKTLASRIRSGKPASAEARQLMEAVERVDALVGTEGMPDEVIASWEAGAPSIQKVAQAYKL
jgi:hypothetical protein